MPIRMGLCKFNMYDISGLAINEAVIQLIISVIFEHEQEYNDYFGIRVKSIQNKYFPILCALLQQVVYILGYNELITSVLNNSDGFEIQFEEFAGQKSYSFLLESFDKMMKARDKIVENNRIINTNRENKYKNSLLEKQVKIYAKEIQNYFLAIQKLCYVEYFKKIIKNVKNEEDLEKLKKEIEKYHDYIGVANEMDDFMVYAQKNIKKLTKKLKKNI